LNKVMAPVADEARGQRAMIHLTQGEVSQARQLADNIDLSRHQDARTRAMLASVVAEAWARSGDAKKANETLALYDPEEATYEQIKPQLYRAMAYAAAHESDLTGMRKALRKLLAIDVRLLGGFMMKKTHPLLQKEAKKMLEQSGQVPRKMVVQRRT
jgi:transposase